MNSFSGFERDETWGQSIQIMQWQEVEQVKLRGRKRVSVFLHKNMQEMKGFLYECECVRTYTTHTHRAMCVTDILVSSVSLGHRG